MAGRRGGKVVRWMGRSPDREVENGEILWWKDGELRKIKVLVVSTCINWSVLFLITRYRFHSSIFHCSYILFHIFTLLSQHQNHSKAKMEGL